MHMLRKVQGVPLILLVRMQINVQINTTFLEMDLAIYIKNF